MDFIRKENKTKNKADPEQQPYNLSHFTLLKSSKILLITYRNLVFGYILLGPRNKYNAFMMPDT